MIPLGHLHIIKDRLHIATFNVLHEFPLKASVSVQWMGALLQSQRVMVKVVILAMCLLIVKKNRVGANMLPEISEGV